jgi:integrase/recombinase XerD
MSQSTDNLTEMADAFGRDADPLAQFEDTFEELDVDPFESYKERVLEPENPSESTRKSYQYAIDRWILHMKRVGRHPACPRETHVKQFAQFLREEYENQDSTIKRRIGALQRIYNWWQDHHAFPHPSDYDPYGLAKHELSFNNGDTKEFPEIKFEELKGVIQQCTNIRERLFLMFLLKLGLRAGELLNVKLSDLAIENESIKQRYPSIGTATELNGYSNAIYVPPKSEREGNKSSNPRILPLDDELRQILIQFLMIRPTVDLPWLVISERTYEKMDRTDCVNRIWKDHFAAYNGSEDNRDITSHYGRHYFTTHWKIREDVQRELVQYMRGDKLGENNGESIDTYLHTYYSDIRELYLNRVFKLL